jgi:PAS domain S-box-containing protein
MARVASIARRIEHASDRGANFDRVLLDLSVGSAVTNGDLDALGEICVAACDALGVVRSGVWLFDERRNYIRSLVVFDAEQGTTLQPAELHAGENPSFFAALARQRVIAADDVRIDPSTRAIAKSYFDPHGVRSMLAAPIRLRGRLLGAMCYAHAGAKRVWEAEEEGFAASLGDLVALALAADERNRAERALRESEGRYRLLVDGARDLIFNLDHDGNLTSLNPAVETLLGRKADDWIGHHFAGLVLPEDLPLAIDLFRRAIAGESLPIFELRLTTADGEAVWFEFTISLRQVGESISDVFGVGREVSARKRADARRRVLAEVGRALVGCGDDATDALAIVEEHVASAIPYDRIAIALFDRETGAVEIAAHSTRGPAGEAPAHTREVATRAIETGETIVVGAGAGGPSGRRPTAVASPLRSPNEVLGVLVMGHEEGVDLAPEHVELCEGVARELTIAISSARRRIEEREDAEVAAALARVGQDLITSVDLPVLLDRLCRTTAEMLGCDVSHTFLRDEAAGAFEQAAAFGDSPLVTEALRALPILDAQAPGLVEALHDERVIVCRPGDGRIADDVWQAYGTSSAIVIALHRGDRVIGAQSAAFRSADRAFGPRHVRIALGIAQLASLALANARLVGELEAANRVKSDFVATMSHELRTPLNVILGYNELLLDGEFGPLEAEQSDTLTRVRSSATQLLEMIEATLDLSRLEAGRNTLDLGEFRVSAWLDEVRAESGALLEQRPDLRVEWLPPPADARAHSDALKLKVILKNLISNAVKFTPAGAVEIGAAVRGDALVIAVRDSGIGMSPETREVIFEPFRQGDASMTRRFDGVGLGLYIVARLVRALSGRVAVESQPGRGTMFVVEVPVDARAVRAA